MIDGESLVEQFLSYPNKLQKFKTLSELILSLAIDYSLLRDHLLRCFRFDDTSIDDLPLTIHNLIFETISL